MFYYKNLDFRSIFCTPGCCYHYSLYKWFSFFKVVYPNPSLNSLIARSVLRKLEIAKEKDDTSCGKYKIDFEER